MKNARLWPCQIRTVLGLFLTLAVLSCADSTTGVRAADGERASLSVETIYDFVPAPALVQRVTGDRNGLAWELVGPSGTVWSHTYAEYNPWFRANYIRIEAYGDPWDDANVVIYVVDPLEIVEITCGDTDVLAGDSVECSAAGPEQSGTLTDISWSFVRSDNSQTSVVSSEAGPTPVANVSFSPAVSGTLRLSLSYSGSGVNTWEIPITVYPDVPPDADIAQDFWNLMNRQERSRCWRHVLECVEVGSTRSIALNRVEDLLRRDGLAVIPENSTDNKYDAFRHAYWSAILALRIGTGSSEVWGTIHEIGAPHYYLGHPSVCMDLTNNSHGRNAVSQVMHLHATLRESQIYSIILNWMDTNQVLQPAPGC